MDKTNKNRTDLLAAGRKKLQQFRQKKDGKGGKSSGKFNKSEHETAKDAARSENVVDGEVPVRDTSDVDVSSEMASEKDLVAIDKDVSIVDQSSKDDFVESTSSMSMKKLPLEDSGVNEATLDLDKENKHDHITMLCESGATCEVREDVELASSQNSETPSSEDKSTYLDHPILSLVERWNGEEQVPDEIGRSGSKQADTTSEMGTERVVTDEDSRKMKEGTRETANNVEGAANMGMASVLMRPSPESKGISVITAHVRGEQINVVSGSSTDAGQVDRADEKVDGEVSSECMVNSSVSAPGSYMLTLSSGSDASLISLSQIAEVIQRLGGDNFKFLFESRNATIEQLPNNQSLNAPESAILDVFERLKDQLYLTIFEKDMSQLQLAEQLELEMLLQQQFEKLVDETSLANASLEKVQRKNEILSEELAQCRSELQEVVSGRDELQKQLQDSKAGVDEFSARVNELRNKLEISEGNLARLGSELVDCRSVTAVLQAENETFNGRLSLVTEEKMKLVEEKEYLVQENEKMATELAQYKTSLASLQLENDNLSENLSLLKEDKGQFNEEKAYLVHEKNKLLFDLEDCRAMVEALGAESSNLKGILTAVEEEKEKLENDKSCFVKENEKPAADLMNSTGSLEALRMEMLNINGRLASLAEERNKLEEEKQYLLSENKSQSHELSESKVVIAGLQAELSKEMGDLKEASSRIEQFTEENVFLRTNLELHVAEVSRYEDAVDQIENSGGRSLINDNGSSLIFDIRESEPSTPVPENTLSEGHSIISLPAYLRQDDSHVSSQFEFWRRHLEEANNVFQKLEKTIEVLQSYLASLSRSGGKPVTSGVSKLIQAFESKGRSDEHELSNLPSLESQITGDPCKQTKEQMEQLKQVLKNLFYEAENACKCIEEERKSKLSAEVMGAELKACCESLTSHSNHLEEENIKLMVLYEALRQLMGNSATRLGELVLLYEASQKQEYALNAENSQLREKLGSFHSKITEFQNLLDGICQNADQVVSSVSNQVESLHSEVGERGLTLEEEWKSFVTQIVQAVEKLDESIETLCSFKSSTVLDNSLEVGMRIVASINAAARVIETLQKQLEAAQRDHEVSLKTCTELDTEFNNLQEKNERAIGFLNKIYCDLRQFVLGSHDYAEGTATGRESEKLFDPLDFGFFDVLMQQLRNLLDEKAQVESINNRLNSHLTDRVREIDELKGRCLDSDSILGLLRDAEPIIKLDSFDIHTFEPLSCLKSLINILIQKYKEAEEQINLVKGESAFNEKHISDLHGQMNQLSLLITQLLVENVVLKESWNMVNEDIPVLHTELLEKVAELEQSEQRVSSLREKLSIAVTKGKGLVVQRDSLKQSLAETSSQLEKCSQELQSKDSRVHELETKLKNYSEAGERMEALESELSYIRNSATALRESFLLKDSVLQRIEEILEDLELPEHFHSRGIIEKVDWLAKSVTGNTLPLIEWDQKSSAGGESYSDGGFAVMDSWKEETQPSQSLVDEFRRRYEELQGKFYVLAEQNEMLEQSLMERNNLVQQWEDILGKIDVPSQLRLLEPEDRIQWFGSALSEAQDHCISLQQRIDYLDSSCGSLSGNLVESQSRISELELAYLSVIVENEFLLESLETLNHHYEDSSKKALQLENRNENLIMEMSSLQKISKLKLANEEQIQHVEGEVKRLQDLIRDVLKGSVTDDSEFDSDSIRCLEQLLRKLIEEYMTLPLANTTDVNVGEGGGVTYDEGRIEDSRVSEEDLAALRKKLGHTLSELVDVKEERDRFRANNQSLICEVEAFDTKKKELQELLNQEEQKSASLREKLNIAVKKGKSLVQQRDSMKQVIEEINAEVDRLKSDISLRENTITEYEQRIRNFSIDQEGIDGVESECEFLRDRLAETEHYLREKEHLLSMMFSSLRDIDGDVDFNLGNPVEHMEAIGKHWHDLRSALDFSDKELRKSKRAAELLLAELNEVQERNDGLQEELAKVSSEFSEIFREKESSEAAKFEALAQLEKLAAVRTEDTNHLSSEVMMLKSNVHQLHEDLFEIDKLVADVLSKDLEILHNLEGSLTSYLEPTNAPHLAAFGTSGDIPFNKLENKIFTKEVGPLKEKLLKHCNLVQEEASRISEVVKTIHSEITSLKHASGARENDLRRLEATVEEKDSELYVTRRNMSLLYEACTIAVMQIENLKALRVGMGTEANLKSQISVDEVNAFLSSEEDFGAVKEKLISLVKDLSNVQSDIVEDSMREMKTLIRNLQKELHEKDIDRERISMEFVSQIKESEAAAKSYLQDLQSAKTQSDDLRSQVVVIEKERTALQDKVKQQEERETAFIDLEQRVASLTDALAAKDQEIEALMQALDEEESQMEDISNKIGELEESLRQKNEDIENLEASRGKALKKLSITVSKFDELHHLSKSLLSEVEKLQSQLQERDGEISFLRQEVTRCTNEALTATQMSHKRNSDEIHELLRWLDMMISRVYMHDMHFDYTEINQVPGHKQLLEKQITSIISELEELRVAVQDKDVLLQAEHGRVGELTQKLELLENSLLEKESQSTVLKRVGDPGHTTSTSSEIVEVEPVINKWATSGSIAHQVRGGRKINSDQVAIAIDMDPNGGIEDEDDDKAHGFKSLTASRIVPRFTRPVSDMIDGLWVSCDRTLMRQPALRLGVIIYWAILHALLAAFVV